MNYIKRFNEGVGKNITIQKIDGWEGYADVINVDGQTWFNPMSKHGTRGDGKLWYKKYYDSFGSFYLLRPEGDTCYLGQKRPDLENKSGYEFRDINGKVTPLEKFGDPDEIIKMIEDPKYHSEWIYDGTARSY